MSSKSAEFILAIFGGERERMELKAFEGITAGLNQILELW